MRKKCSIASRNHDICTKINATAQSQGAVKSETTCLVEKIWFPEEPSVTTAWIIWGIDQAPTELKCFYLEHSDKHQHFLNVFI